MIPFFWVTGKTWVQNLKVFQPEGSDLGKYFILDASKVQLQALSQVPLSEEEMTGEYFRYWVI